jgi:cytochrome c biogenesis protein ResB
LTGSILRRAGEPQNAQKSHKNQAPAFWNYLADLVIPEIVSTSWFIYVTYVLSAANCRLPDEGKSGRNRAIL